MIKDTIKKKLERRKIITSVVFGLLGFFLAGFIINFRHESTILSVQWSFIFPLIAALAYGWKYGLITGTIGLGALYPFTLCPENGWANLIPVLVLIIWFAYIGYFSSLYDKAQKLCFHPITVHIPFMFLMFIMYRYLYPVLLDMNPPFFASNIYTNTSLSIDGIKNIVIQSYIIYTTGLLLTLCLMRMTFIRRLLGLETLPKQKYNPLIFIKSLAVSALVWIIYLFISKIYILDLMFYPFLAISSSYDIIVGFALFLTGLFCAYIYMFNYENKYLSKLALQNSEARIQAINDNLQSAMIYQIMILLDNESKFIYISDTVNKLYGATPEEIYENPDLIYDKIHPEDLNLLQEIKSQSIKSNKAYSCEIRIMNTDSSYRWSSVSISPQVLADGKIILNVIELNITDIKSKQNHIEYLSYHDHLTGLYNRRYYEKVMMELDDEEYLPFSMIMADVNGLKLTNDAFGHNAGDELLINASKIMESICLDNDIVARIGGDEFVILLPNTNAGECLKTIEKLNKEIAKQNDDDIIISISFGSDTRVSMDIPLTKIFIQAENQMYRSKLTEGIRMRNDTIKNIIRVLHKTNPQEHDHCTRVSKICVSIGKALNLDENKITDLKAVGFLHDIGKIAIPKNIVSKVGQLNEYEWLEMKKHSEVGYHILKSSSETANISKYVLYHHERVDGKGYQMGLTGDAIPIPSKILLIADAYDSMTTDRVYRKAMSKEEAIAELKLFSGTQFDSEIVKIFIEKVLGEKM